MNAKIDAKAEVELTEGYWLEKRKHFTNDLAFRQCKGLARQTPGIPQSCSMENDHIAGQSEGLQEEAASQDGDLTRRLEALAYSFYMDKEEEMRARLGEMTALLAAAMQDDGYHDIYRQAHAPMREQQRAEGHAVRAMYLYCTMADMAVLNGDAALADTLKNLWQSVCNRRMYVTGEIGSEAQGERFSFDYDLPNDRVYAETCASIGVFLWGHRMRTLDPSSEYADMMEHELYNGVLSGISVDGKRFFCSNPLRVDPSAAAFRYDQARVEARRLERFGCACCSSNITRLMQALHRYIFRVRGNAITVDLYISSMLLLKQEPLFEINTDYPVDDRTEVRYLGKRPGEYQLRLRIPAWCKRYMLRRNGHPQFFRMEQGYAVLFHVFQPGDVVTLDFFLCPRIIRANPAVAGNVGKCCLAYGPMIYCLEQEDNGSNLHQVLLDAEAQVECYSLPNELGSYPGLTGMGARLERTEALYTEASLPKEVFRWKAVPYHLWGNRTPGEMTVWMQEETVAQQR